MKAVKIIGLILVIGLWLFLVIYLNLIYYEGLFVLQRGFPLTWEYIKTEGVVIDEKGLSHTFNYINLIADIAIISFLYFSIVYPLIKIITLKRANFVQKLLFSSALSVIYSLMTSGKIVSNPDTRKMSYYQSLRVIIMPVHGFFYNFFGLALNITNLMMALHFFINFLGYFFLVSFLLKFMEISVGKLRGLEKQKSK